MMAFKLVSALILPIHDAVCKLIIQDNIKILKYV